MLEHAAVAPDAGDSPRCKVGLAWYGMREVPQASPSAARRVRYNGHMAGAGAGIARDVITITSRERFVNGIASDKQARNWS